MVIKSINIIYIRTCTDDMGWNYFTAVGFNIMFDDDDDINKWGCFDLPTITSAVVLAVVFVSVILLAMIGTKYIFYGC
jgi:hypothetical protein